VFPVRYELNFYTVFRRNSVCKGLTGVELTSAIGVAVTNRNIFTALQNIFLI
jgi:hypothetical protein